MKERIYNFSAGPAVMPTSVLEQVQKELLNYNGSGMSIMELSHRGGIFDAVYKESVASLRKLAAIPDRFDILYMTGGASTQFAFVPINLANINKKAGYANTGVWSQKAIEQSKLIGVETLICADVAPDFKSVPKKVDVPSGLDYLHLTSNNTIYGTQYASLPEVKGTPVVVDMSSDFLSRPIVWDNLSLVYAGVQKNAGASGLTIVIIDRELYARELNSTPTMFRYSTFAKNESMYNTPPTFQIYLFNLILTWLHQSGGLANMEKVNIRKAALIYDALDSSNGFYIPHAEKESRSLMNITFNLSNKSLESLFLKEAEANDLHGLKGHRAVGGIRASTYNAMSEEGCSALASFLREFAKKN